MLQSIEEKVSLSINDGRRIRIDHCQNKWNAKTRRHSGRVTPRWGAKGKYSQEIADANEPQVYWDDWRDKRDGMRWDNDKTHLRPTRVWCHHDMERYDSKHYTADIITLENKKVRKKIKIRKARKLNYTN